MKPKRITLETIQELAQDLADAIDELRVNEEDFIAKSLMSTMYDEAMAAVKRCEGLITLRDFRGYKFAVIDPETQEIRKATHDEATRIALHFPPASAGSVIDILKKYDIARQKAQDDGTPPPDTSNWDWLTKA